MLLLQVCLSPSYLHRKTIHAIVLNISKNGLFPSFLFLYLFFHLFFSFNIYFYLSFNFSFFSFSQFFASSYPQFPLFLPLKKLPK